MSLMRKVLLASSTNAWLRERATKAAFVRRSVRKFWPGERVEDALAAARDLQPLGITTILTALGENLTKPEEAEEVTQHYLEVFARRPYLPGYVISEITHHPGRLPPLFAALAGTQIKKRVLTKLGQQIDERVRAGTLAKVAPEQFLINIISLCVFPFAARPIIMVALGLDAKGFDRFIAQRRETLPPFVARALRP